MRWDQPIRRWDDLPEEVRRRLLCLALIQQLSQEGLTEAEDALRRMVEYYAERLPALPAPAVRKSIPVPVSKRVRATVVPIAED